MTRKENKRYKELKKIFESFTKEDYQKDENKGLVQEWYDLNRKIFNSIGRNKPSGEKYIGV